jgi:light-harvesting complex II chlorophyll a/b binding protein 4
MALKMQMAKKFSLPSFGGKSAAPKAATRKVSKPSPAPVKKSGTVSTGTRKGGVGYRKYEGDALWLPNTTRPGWLDGTLPGDRGFDPLGLARPAGFVQIAVDENDINAAKNFKGGVDGTFQAQADQVTETRLAPYSEVFGLQRFRECELIHGRWAMLACLGCIVAEGTTGVSWVEAGKVELDGASYAGFDLPFSITQLVWIEVLAVGGAEIYRNTELDTEKRLYPGGYFDPLNLADGGDPEKVFRLKTAEIKHGRLAMVGFLGYGVQALSTGEGALGSLARFGESF